MKVLLLLGLVFLAFGAKRVQYEFGVENSIHWAPTPYHALQKESGVPRNVLVTVKFKEAFKDVPKIIIGSIYLDFFKGQPSGFDAEIVDIKLDQFTLKYTAVSPNALYGLTFNWAAFFDPKIEVQQFYTNEVGDLGTGDNKVRSKEYPIKFNNKYAAPPRVSVFFTGVQWTQKNNCLSLATKSITATGLTLTASTWYTSKVAFFRAMLIIAPASTIYTGAMKFKIPNNQHALATRNPESERTVGVENDITDEKYTRQDAIPFYGFSIIDQDDWANHRTITKTFELLKKKVKIDVGTWQNSVLMQFELQYFLYIPDLDTPIIDEDCAEIYEQCNYSGDSLTICTKEDNVPRAGWNKPVKSIRVPKDKVLKLYNLENLKGWSVRVEESIECVEQLRFSFEQLYAELE